MNTRPGSAYGQPRRQFLARLVGLAGLGAGLAPTHLAAAESVHKPGPFNVRDFGAVGDGSTMDTRALQKAIAACAGAGGGTVAVPAGQYLTGTLTLESRVRLYLESGAVLLGSRNLEDYPVRVPKLRSYTDQYTERSLIYAEGLEDIALEGHGVIDGRGAAFAGPYKVRPFLIRLVGCRRISVRDLRLQDSPMWVQHYLACDDLVIDGLTVDSHCNHNNDGLDLDGCERVRVANCDIRSGDDAIVLKSTLDRPCRDIVVTNCVLSSDCNAFKLGTESTGGFQNIVLSNCALHETRLAGIALECVDGGVLDGITITNVSMRNVNGPIFIRLGDRARPHTEGVAKPGVGRLRNVSISNVQATGADRIGCSITGLPDHPAEGISLSHIQLTLAGGGTEEDAQRPVPEHPEKYPEYQMFGVLPAAGLYCRHVRGLRLHQMRIAAGQPDQRPSLICDDVDGLDLFGWQATAASGSGW